MNDEARFTPPPKRFELRLSQSPAPPKFSVTIKKSKEIFAEIYDIKAQPWTVQLTPNDDVMPRAYMHFAYFFKNFKGKSAFMSSRRLKKSLAYILRFFPILSGRLRDLPDGGMDVFVGNKGVQFIKASGEFTMGDLESHGFDINRLPNGLTPSHTDIDYLLRVQATYLKDNSLVLSILIQHNVCDGLAAATFIKAWAEMCTHMEEKLADLDVSHDRTRLYPDFKPPRYPHNEYRIIDPKELPDDDYKPPKSTVKVFHLSNERLNDLKDAAKGEHANSARISRNDALCALFWRAVTRAREIPQDNLTSLGVTVNGRDRLNPPLPKGYFGNANFYASSRLEVGDLLSQPLSQTASVIRQSVDAVTDDYIRSAINWIESQADKEDIAPGFDCYFGKDLAVTSWVNFPVFDADFGDGRPVAFRVPVKAFDGLIIILPTREEGSWDVVIGLKKEHMENLLNDSELKHMLQLK